MLKELQATVEDAINQFKNDGTFSWESYQTLEMWLSADMAHEVDNPMTFSPAEVATLTESILTDMKTGLDSLAEGALNGLSDEEIMEGDGYFTVGDLICPLWTELCGVQTDHTQRAQAQIRRTREMVAEATEGLEIDFDDPESMAQVAEALNAVIQEQIIEEAVDNLDADIEAFLQGDN